MTLSQRRVLLGELVSFDDDPRASSAALRHHEDGALLVEGGRIRAAGEARDVLAAAPPGTPLDDHRGRFLLPGFIDAHVHYAQTDIVAAPGETLLGWLERHVFAVEAGFGDPERARECAEFFLDECLRNGTTGAGVFATVHEQSAEALFAAAAARGMRIAAGKVLMDRNCPEPLRESAEQGYDASKALIERWHGKGRLAYAVTPRFAPTSSPAQLQAAAALLGEHPSVLLQTHVAENRGEVNWVRELFPDARSYLDVYERHGLLCERSVLAHGIWLDDTDRSRLADAGAAVAFCPSSNLFLGSGLFPYERTREAGVKVALASDVGAGTGFSMLRVMHDAYKVARLLGERFDAFDGFYLATLGAARALGMAEEVGSLTVGREADIVALDPRATPLLERRMARAGSLEERLFALMVLGDDRSVAATYVMGEPRWQRPAA